MTPDAIDPGGWAPYLEPGERLVWQGAPSADPFVFRWVEPLILTAGIVATFLVARPYVEGSRSPVVYAGFALGAWLLLGRLLYDWIVRRRTVYALSTRRAFIATRVLGQRIRALRIAPGVAITHLPETPVTRGAVTFGPVAEDRPLWTRADLLRLTGDDDSFTWRQIDDADAVHDLACRVRAAL